MQPAPFRKKGNAAWVSGWGSRPGSERVREDISESQKQSTELGESTEGGRAGNKMGKGEEAEGW